MNHAPELSRRSFLVILGSSGACLALGCVSTKSTTGLIDSRGLTWAPSVFLRIDPDGVATVTVSKSDMGQGTRTSFAMIVAEELDVDWAAVRVEQADGDPQKYGRQMTGGSGSHRQLYNQLRTAGATARHMLLAAAAKQWDVEPGGCSTEAGKVYHGGNGKSLDYGELTEAAAVVDPPAEGSLKFKSKDEYRIVGKPTPRIDNEDVVTGRAVFGMDVRVPGAVVAVIARPPAFGARLRSFDDSEARAVTGVTDIAQVGRGVAVCGTNTWAAMQGRNALKVDWNLGPNAGLDSAKIDSDMRAATREHKPMPDGAKVVEATFDFPFLSHATMEPMNCVADVRGDKAEVWAPTQGADSARTAAARALGVPEENVTLHVTMVGGGFGRRLSQEYVSEAVAVSKEVGKPVRLVWSREDDMKNDNYRPCSHHSIRGAVSGGKAIGWSHQYVKSSGRGGSDYGSAALPYRVPDAGMLRLSSGAPIPTGAWRSVDSTHIVAVNECFIDELAHAAGADPYEFRMAHMPDGKLKNVLRTAVENSDWGKQLPEGHGLGIGCFSGYGSCAAHVVEVSVLRNRIRVHRVVAAVDTNLAINPLGIKAQVEGGCIDGLSTSLKSAITIDKGAVVQNNWHDFEWLHFSEAPEIEVHVLESGGGPGGMGEVGYPGVPGAVANAVFAATGKRVRRFPIKLGELV